MKEFTEYLETEMERLQKEEAALRNGERKDEANLKRVRCNIFEVCETVWNVLSQKGISSQYPAKLDAILASWKISLEKAQAHGDIEKVTIEQIKLQAMSEIQDKFCSMAGGTEDAGNGCN